MDENKTPPSNIYEQAASMLTSAQRITQGLIQLHSVAHGIASAVGEENLPVEFKVTMRNLFFTIQGRQGSLMELQTPDLLSLDAFANLLAQMYVYLQDPTRVAEFRAQAAAQPDPQSKPVADSTASGENAPPSNVITAPFGKPRAKPTGVGATGPAAA